MIGAGRRNKRITIQEVTTVTSDGGEATETWTTQSTVWAGIDPLTSREMWLAKQSQAITTHKITMLYQSGITSRMRAVWQSRIFNFESVVNVDESNRELIIMATEVMP